MKTFLSTLAVTLAFTFTAAPADAALSNADKCNVFRAKTEMNFSKCMKIANLLEAKGKTADRAKCVTKYDDGIAKAKTKFVNEKLNVTEAECGLEQASTDAVKALDIVSAGQELATFGLDDSDLAIGTDIQSLIDEAVAGVDITSDNAAAEQAGCEAAGGTWENDACTPVAVADRDCFREGACGSDGWDYGTYAGGTAASTGCGQTVSDYAAYESGFTLTDYVNFPTYYTYHPCQ